MTILDDILANKRIEVGERKKLSPTRTLEQSALFDRHPVSLREHVVRADRSGIIAEIKRKSPSKGVINSQLSIEQTSIGYEQAGASALSVLTDQVFFGGTNEDLGIARKSVSCPILRKDFVIDEYQVIEAKAIGADAILLIAAALNPVRIKQLAALAHSLGLEVLMEVHDEKELQPNVESGADLIGVNNRDLKTFAVDIGISKRLAPMIPGSFVKVSESGIESPEVIVSLEEFGYRGFLIGQRFMEMGQPEESARLFIETLNSLRKEKRR